MQRFYERLLTVLAQAAVRDGEWRLLECVPAWDGNWTSDCFLAWMWKGNEGELRLVAVNYAGNQSQCYVRLPAFGNRVVRIPGSMESSVFDRRRSRTRRPRPLSGYAAWGYHVLEITSAKYSAVRLPLRADVRPCR